MNDKYFNTEDLIFYKDNNDNIFSCGYKINSSLMKNKILDKKTNLTDEYYFPSAITSIQENIFSNLNKSDNTLENILDFNNDLDSNIGSNINDTIPESIYNNLLNILENHKKNINDCKECVVIKINSSSKKKSLKKSKKQKRNKTKRKK
tara:strand:+ start:51 stop:497 length:447 start_codon:yes stop_codon:yes gene_type:complete